MVRIIKNKRRRLEANPVFSLVCTVLPLVPCELQYATLSGQLCIDSLARSGSRLQLRVQANLDIAPPLITLKLYRNCSRGIGRLSTQMTIRGSYFNKLDRAITSGLPTTHLEPRRVARILKVSP